MTVCPHTSAFTYFCECFLLHFLILLGVFLFFPATYLCAAVATRFGTTHIGGRIRYLSVVDLHVRNVGFSFGEPLQTLAACPAAGLRARPAGLLGPFSGAICLFARVVILLPLDRRTIRVTVSLVFFFSVLFSTWGFCISPPEINIVILRSL